MNWLLTLGTIVLIGGLLLALTWRQRAASRQTALRPLPGYQMVQKQVGLAVENGRRIHVGLGQTGLTSSSAPTSLAALQVLDYLAQDGCANHLPPSVTVGEGTLLPAAENSLHHAYAQSQLRPAGSHVQFIASDSDRLAYAAGVANEIRSSQFASNILVGHFGSELALITAVAQQQELSQVIGTDDPLALALATAVTDQVLIGEELLAAGAYLTSQPGQIASLQVQDILRWVIAALILGLALYQVAT